MYREVWEGCMTQALCEFAWVTGCGNAPLNIKISWQGGKVHGCGIGVTQNVTVLQQRNREATVL